MEIGKDIVAGVEGILENRDNTANGEDTSNKSDTVNKSGYASAREALEKEITDFFDNMLFADGKVPQREREALEREFIRLFDMVLHGQDSQLEPVSLGMALGNLFDTVLFIEEKAHNLIGLLEVLYSGIQGLRGEDESQEVSCIGVVCDYVKFIYQADLGRLHQIAETLLDVYGDGKTT